MQINAHNLLLTMCISGQVSFDTVTVWYNSQLWNFTCRPRSIWALGRDGEVCRVLQLLLTVSVNFFTARGCCRARYLLWQFYSLSWRSVYSDAEATQLNWPTSHWLAVRCNWVSCIADRRRQLSCVGEGVYSDATHLNSTRRRVESL